MYILVGQSYDDAKVLFVSESLETITKKKEEFWQLNRELDKWQTLAYTAQNRKFPPNEKYSCSDRANWMKQYELENPRPFEGYIYEYTFIQEAELI